MNSDFPSNVVNSTGGPLHVEGERVFLQRLFRELEKRMADEFRRLTFVVHFRTFGEFAGSKINLMQGDANHVLILIADEQAVFPVEEFGSYRMIFRAHGNPPGGKSRIQPFPIGYFNEPGEQIPIPFEERTTSVFFSGYMNRNRVDLYKQFQPIWWLPRRNLPSNRYIKELARRAVSRIHSKRNFDGSLHGGRIQFTEWFGKGLPPAEYARLLADTKIALCPPGFVMSETIRHWEAMRLGCVVISAPLPPIQFYKGGPIIELDDWSDIKPLLNDLLANPEKLRRIHEATVDWWNRKCSEAAVADLMASALES